MDKHGVVSLKRGGTDCCPVLLSSVRLIREFEGHRRGLFQRSHLLFQSKTCSLGGLLTNGYYSSLFLTALPLVRWVLRRCVMVAATSILQPQRRPRKGQQHVAMVPAA